MKEAAAKFQKRLEAELGGPTKGAALTGRYVGAQGHEARKKDEQSRLIYWGHSMPLLRQLYRTVTPADLGLEEQWQLWLEVFRQSQIAEIKTLALMWMAQPRLKELRRKKSADLFKMVDQIDNWAHSDSLSSLLAELLEFNPKHFPTYQKWNKSRKPWLRRQSIVGLYCYARQRKTHLPADKALKLIEALLEDPHFYVQRGVGWALREVDRVDSKKQRAFVKKNLHRIGGVAWFATSELYPKNLRNDLVQLRKAKRKKS